MLLRAQKYLLLILGFGLPLHGLLTVFTPDVLRWWKEGVVFLLLLTVCIRLCLTIRFEPRFFTQWRHSLQNCFLGLIKHPITWVFLFLLWGLILLLTNQDLQTSLVAYRYLAFGFFATLLGYLLWKTSLYSGKNGYEIGLILFHNFCTGLLLGVFASTLIGVWAKFLGGFDVLDRWYSQTISSWVPGQTIPIYHQVGDFIRLQGASSGPVEYAHLAVIAVWYVLFFKPFKLIESLWVKGALLAFLSFGIWHSGSRAALIGLLVLGLGVGWLYLKQRIKLPPINWTADKLAALLLVVIVLTVMLKFTATKAILGESALMSTNIVRMSDVDHFTRPLAAFNKALESPFIGSLGALGPAARAKNLVENNNDQAMIAESVPFDIMAQLGFIGFLLWLFFFIFLYRRAAPELRVLLVAFTPMMLLATIFDMSPVAISFYLILGLGLIFPQRLHAQTSDFNTVYTLKELAFKPYIEAVWGWKETEQKQFVTQELAQGGIYLINLEGRTVATYCLVKEAHETKVFSFYVHPDWQNLGLGRYLLNSVLPAGNLRLNVLKVNSSAKAFYESHGFKVEGEDEFHWHLSRLI